MSKSIQVENSVTTEPAPDQPHRIVTLDDTLRESATSAANALAPVADAAVTNLVLVADHLMMLAEDYNRAEHAEIVGRTFQREAHKLASELSGGILRALICAEAGDSLLLGEFVHTLGTVVGRVMVKMVMGADHLMNLSNGLNHQGGASEIANAFRVEAYTSAEALGDSFKALSATWSVWRKAEARACEAA